MHEEKGKGQYNMQLLALNYINSKVQEKLKQKQIDNMLVHL